jgi:hypothetical protein
MGMMLRRHKRKPETTPMVNGKPVVKEPKTKKLNKEPSYVKKEESVNPMRAYSSMN